MLRALGCCFVVAGLAFVLGCGGANGPSASSPEAGQAASATTAKSGGTDGSGFQVSPSVQNGNAGRG